VTPLHRHASWWLALAVGIGLRVIGLSRQVINGDEIHAFTAVLRLHFPEVLYRIVPNGNSPPLNAWLRLWMDLGSPPSELVLRIPILVAGVTTLVLVSWWAQRQFGTATAIIVAWLLALWPHLIFHSRFMRPYMPAVLCASVAVAAFHHWWRTGRTAAGILYAATAALSVYLLLPTGPYVLAPFLFVAGELILAGGRARRSRMEILTLGAVVAVPIGLLVVASRSNVAKIAANVGTPGMLLQPDRLLDLLRQFSGTAVPPLMVVFIAALVVGAVRLARADRALLAYVVCLTVAQVVGILWIGPLRVEQTPIFFRFVLVIVVPATLLAALGLSAPWPIRRVVAPAFLLAFWWTGPFADLQRLASPFSIAENALTFERPPAALAPGPQSTYAQLADGPPGAVVEALAHPDKLFTWPLYEAWKVHHRPVRLAGELDLASPLFDLRSIAPMHPARLLAGDAAYLAVHRDWVLEFGATLGFSTNPELARLQRLWFERNTKETADWIATLERAWGAPDLRDDLVVIWNLTRLRTGQTP
jgi:hypothetical protein